MDEIDVPGVSETEEIGRGGFGVVYKATETDLRRNVAVKVLRTNLDARGRDRFDRERQAMGSLSGHPNIVTVYRSGFTDTDRAYIVMEYLEKGSMHDRLATEGPLGWREAASVGVDIAGALETAHRAGVLHRDIKPGNILQSATGQSKLGDFGIARIAGSPETTSSTVTASVAHAAPEVIDGQRPTIAADIYSLASTLFELVAGSPPFSNDRDESLVPMLARIARDPIPPLVDVPAPFFAVLERAMAKSPDARHESAAAFGQALAAARESVGPTDPPGPVVMATRTFATAPAQPGNPGGHPLPPAASAEPERTTDSPEVPVASTKPRSSDRRKLWLGLGTSLTIVALVGAIVLLTRDSDDPESPNPGPAAGEGPTEAVGTQLNGVAGAALPQTSGTDYPSYTTVFDFTGAIRVEIPTAWAEVDIGSDAFQPTLLASPDLVGAIGTFDTPGLGIVVFGQPLLDADQAIAGVADDECAELASAPYNDGLYTGLIKGFGDCGTSGARQWIVAASPLENDFTVLVSVQALDDADESAARRALDTFVIERLALS